MDFSGVTKLLEDTKEHITGPGRDCIVYVNGEQVYRHFAGYRDGELKIPMDGNELYNFYSCSKVSTCTAALTLVDKGILNLGDPISKYLPEFEGVKLKSGEETQVPTVWNLLTMTAGFNYNIYNPSFTEAQKQNPAMPTVWAVSHLAKEGLDFEAGSRFQYSLCHDVLAAVVEKASGKRYSEYLYENVFEPLGVCDVKFKFPQTEIDSRMATQYGFETGEVAPMGNGNRYRLGEEFESGGAGLIGSIDSYVKFLDMLTNGGKAPDGKVMLREETVNLMRKPVLSGEVLESFHKNIGWNTDGYNYGLGVYVLKNPQDAGSFASAGTFGWDGAAGSFISLDPEKHITVFFTQHFIGANPHLYHEELRNEIYKALER